MARLTKLVLMFAAIVGSETFAPAPTSAGVIPWAYNAIFGPVGSLRGGYSGPTYVSYRTRRHAATTVAYAPATAYGGGGCSTCNQSTNYAPAYYTASYVPYTTAYAPSYGYDAFYGNYSQTAYYGGSANYGSSCCNTCSGCTTCGTGCSTCGYGQACSSCGGGGCSSCNNGVNYANFNGGSTCSNCSVNSAPMQSGPTPAGYGSNSSGYGSNTSGYGNSNYGNNNVGAPVPDPYNSRDINARLNELEHRQTEDEKFLRKLHKNDYQPDPYSRPSTYRERDETVPARRKNTTIDSNTANPDTYEPPVRGRTPAPTIDLEEERRKPHLAAPTPIEEKTNDKGNDGAVNFKEDEPQTRRLEDRATTQAIAPRQRMQIVTKQTKAMIAKSNKPVKTSSADTGSAKLAKN